MAAQPGPDSVLAAWLTLEVLAPQANADARELEAMGRTLVRLEEYPEPWSEATFGRRGNERAVYWMVYLGELDLAQATSEILKMFPDGTVDERADVCGTTSLAVIVVDSRGRPVPEKTFLSSFAWGYGQVRAGRLRGLSGFPEAERAIKTELERRMIRQDEEGSIQPLTNPDLHGAAGWLTALLNLPHEGVKLPGVAIRVPQWGVYSEPPEPELLNSFFLGDLVKARAAFGGGQVGHALSAFMGTARGRERHDVVQDKGIIAETLAPERTPLCRWPSPGRHPLVLMQQAAINHTVAELRDGGLVAVNGPPGTGKTTLLRDIVAKVVLDRAIAMSKFDRPAQAFSHVTTMRTGQAYTHLYQLDESLIGHEVVVASSNNKAVENISREIPSTGAIAHDLNPPLRYFQSVSDIVAAGKGPITVGATWGLAAAVLGNSANRAAFVQSFYWHKKRGMALYLKAVLGGDLPEGGDEGDEAREEDVLDVIALERPPRGEIEAQERWRTARRSFLARLKDVESLRQEAHAAHDAVRQRPNASRRADDSARDLLTARQAYASAAEREGVAKRQGAEVAGAEHRAAEDRAAINRLRPGIFARLFFTRTFRDWRAEMSAAHDVLVGARSRLKAAVEAEQQAAKATAFAKKTLGEAERWKQEADGALARLMATIAAFGAKAGASRRRGVLGAR